MSGFEILALAGTALSAVGAVAKGAQDKALGEAQAQAADRQADEARAVGQREAIERSREAKLLMSRGQAVAAASGGGATDPSVMSLMGGIAAQGAYNTSSAVFDSESQARGLEDQGVLSRWEGRQKQMASFIDAGSTILSGASGFAKSKYERTLPKETMGTPRLPTSLGTEYLPQWRYGPRKS